MFTLFRRRRNAARQAYRKVPPQHRNGVSVPTRPNAAPAWAYAPTVALPRPGRAGWLTPAQAWRANGGRW